jgi:ribonucleoside-triphosphate reductase (thioredoxin)
MKLYEDFIHLSRYSRFLDEENRRETWEETVGRLVKFWRDRVSDNVISDEEFDIVEKAILKKEIMPSMRAMWSAGTALDKNPFRGYNCSFVAIDDIRAFDEILYILMSGTGVGFACESYQIRNLPIVNDNFVATDRVIPVEDSAEGWAKCLRKHIAELYLGRCHTWDFSKIRPAGARLKTMGGRASGPAPLAELLLFCTNIFKKAGGRKLTQLEVHDIVCKIAEVVVVGGVRRSALISLSDLGSTEMRDAKSGNWWEREGQRALANNSAVYDSKPDILTFMDEWTALIRSYSGERGIFSRYGAQKKNNNGRRDASKIVGTNPCAEILLRSMQLCNLSEVVARQGDAEEDLARKVRAATILGTLQASLTEFKYVRKTWQKNCEEERLLGVSLTGIQDCELLQNPTPELLSNLRQVAIDTNAEYAKRLGINAATAITTVKPSGTVSQLVDSASGIHGRFSPYYIRAVRQDNKDPLTAFLKSVGVPNEPAFGKENETTVFYFPMKSPEGAVLASEQTAIEQLENWLLYQTYWSEHSVSVTVYVKPDEWLKVGDWVYDHFDQVTGISFLPHDNGSYKQAPYTACTKEAYEEALAAFPKGIDLARLADFESEDNTEGAQTLACVSGYCEI